MPQCTWGVMSSSRGTLVSTSESLTLVVRSARRLRAGMRRQLMNAGGATLVSLFQFASLV